MIAPDSRSHLRTVGAIVMAIILLLPATMLMSFMWRLSGVAMIEEDLSNTWLPALVAFPVRLFGVFSLGIAGAALAFYGATSLLKGASIEAASYAVASIAATFTIGLVAVVVATDHDIMRHVDTLAQGAGFVVGTFVAASSRT
ncbi:hypothetical protein [uncultured Methylobacterium sp.]|uniref:hypothetical protein n=1 Tax=uncultured Methylobacterium sp. TaxID=157278 RepID=UPI0035CC103D